MTGSLSRVWVNGDLVDPTAPSIAALDHVVTVGDGVFETAKIDRGRPFALSRHHARLERSAAGLGLPPVDLALVGKGIDAVLEGEPIDFGRLRYSVTGGIGPLGSDRAVGDLTYIVVAAPQAPPPASAKARHASAPPFSSRPKRRRGTAMKIDLDCAMSPEAIALLASLIRSGMPESASEADTSEAAMQEVDSLADHLDTLID